MCRKKRIKEGTAKPQRENAANECRRWKKFVCVCVCLYVRHCIWSFSDAWKSPEWPELVTRCQRIVGAFFAFVYVHVCVCVLCGAVVKKCQTLFANWLASGGWRLSVVFIFEQVMLIVSTASPLLCQIFFIIFFYNKIFEYIQNFISQIIHSLAVPVNVSFFNNYIAKQGFLIRFSFFKYVYLKSSWIVW